MQTSHNRFTYVCMSFNENSMHHSQNKKPLPFFVRFYVWEVKEIAYRKRTTTAQNPEMKDDQDLPSHENSKHIRGWLPHAFRIESSTQRQTAESQLTRQGRVQRWGSRHVQPPPYTVHQQLERPQSSLSSLCSSCTVSKHLRLLLLTLVLSVGFSFLSLARTSP